MTIAIDAGGARCHVLVDGSRRVSPRFVFHGFDDAVQGPFVRHLMGEDGKLPGRLAALLVETEGGPVLVDTGMGPYGAGHPSGLVPDELSSLGVAPEDVRTVVISHGHADHVGGILLPDGSPRYANARHVIHKAEKAFWLSPEAADLPRDAAVPARLALPELEGAGLLEHMEGRMRIASLDVFEAPGHTPGHLSCLIGDAMLWAADALTHELNVTHPEWTSAADMDHGRSEITRRELLAMVADRDLLLGAVHMQVAGRVSRTREEGFSWADRA